MGGSLRSPSGAYGAAVPGSRFPVLARRYAPRGSRFPVPRSLLDATRLAVPGSTFWPRLRRGLRLRSRFAPMHFELSGDTNPEPGTSNREPCREPRTAAPQARQNREPRAKRARTGNREPGTASPPEREARRRASSERSAPAGEQRAGASSICQSLCHKRTHPTLVVSGAALVFTRVHAVAGMQPPCPMATSLHNAAGNPPKAGPYA